MTENTYLTYGECYQMMPREVVPGACWIGFDMAKGSDRIAVIEKPIEYRTVTIPACEEHEGFNALTVTLPWVCLECGGPRGEPLKTWSYDGSRRLAVHGWENPCGHIEQYNEVRVAIAANKGD